MVMAFCITVLSYTAALRPVVTVLTAAYTSRLYADTVRPFTQKGGSACRVTL